VTVVTESGDIAYGPEEIMGSLTVGHLRRRVTSASDLPTGCLTCDGFILRDSMEVGVYASSASLRLVQVSDAFSMLAAACAEELSQLRALPVTPFLGHRCIRIGRGDTRRHSCEGEVGRGESHSEFLLLPDGRILAKAYSYWALAKAPSSTRAWKYEIAEGTFSILDPECCLIELQWRRWAERLAGDENVDGPPSADILQDWEEKEVEEANQPHHLVPCGTLLMDPAGLYGGVGQLNILLLAQQVLEGYTRTAHIDPRHDPLAGLPMPGVDKDVLSNLGMDESEVTEQYFHHGQKPAGPRDHSGNYMWIGLDGRDSSKRVPSHSPR